MQMTLSRARLIVLVAAIGCRGNAPTEASGPPSPSHPSGAATAKAGWVTVIGGAGQDEANSVAVTSDGVLVVGTHDGPIQTPSGVAQSSGSDDTFIAKLSDDGHLTWLRTFGSSERDFAWSVTATKSGAVVAIETDGTMQIDGTPTRTAEQEHRGEQPPVLLAIDPQGKQAWEKSLAGENGAIRAVASRGDDVAVAGWSLVRSGLRDLGTGPMDCDTAGMFVGVWSVTGEARWVRCSRARSDSAGQVPAAVAFGADGRVAFCARVSEGAVAFGGPPIDVAYKQHAVVVAAFAPDGKPLWIAAPAIDPNAECSGIVVASDGSVIVAANTGVGRATGEVIALADGKVTWRVTVPALLGAPRGLASALTASGADVLLAARTGGAATLVTLDPRTGAVKGPPVALGDMEPTALAVGHDIYVVGDTENNVTVTGHAVTGRGKKDVVVVAVPR